MEEDKEKIHKKLLEEYIVLAGAGLAYYYCIPKYESIENQIEWLKVTIANINLRESKKQKLLKKETRQQKRWRRRRKAVEKRLKRKERKAEKKDNDKRIKFNMKPHWYKFLDLT